MQNDLSAIVDRPTALYRIFDAEDRLLYIGIAHDPEQRIASHLQTKPWATDAASQSITWYMTRAEAAAAEDEAIKTEGPIHNIAGTAEFGQHLGRQRRRGANGDVAGSRHLDRTEATRVPHEVADAARDALKPQMRTVHAFLGACLNALAADPGAILGAVEGHWPEPKRRGRPPKSGASRTLPNRSDAPKRP